MGLSLFAYVLLAISGIWMLNCRLSERSKPASLRPFHYITGAIMVCSVLLLLAIGLVGTIGHYGSLGHSLHLIAGLSVVGLVMISAFSATQISSQGSLARSLHVGTNIILLAGLIAVTFTGWSVVQKYLP